MAAGWGLIPLDHETAKFIAEDIELEYAEEQADFAQEQTFRRAAPKSPSVAE
jgi:hypothetical protein